MIVCYDFGYICEGHNKCLNTASLFLFPLFPVLMLCVAGISRAGFEFTQLKGVFMFTLLTGNPFIVPWLWLFPLT